MGVEFRLVCDKCNDDEYPQNVSPVSARQFARENGWRVERNNITVCPACIDEEKEFARADAENA